LDVSVQEEIEMAKMSIQVQNRRAKAAYVVSSVAENRDVVTQGLLAHNAYLPAELRIGEETVRMFLEWVANTMHFKTDAMLASETEYVNEQADDPPVRARRDAAMPVLSLCMSQTRNQVSAVLGDTGLITYGLRDAVPRAPVELADYAGVVAGLLRRHPRSEASSVVGPFDTAVLASAVDAALAPLASALDELVTEQRQLQGAMLRRDAIVGEWREVYTNGAATFSSLSCMAGQAELGRRVRPTRRSRGSDGNPGDDLSPEVPASDDDPAGEDPVVNPGPVVAGARSE
jgi:hypothetical protein